MPLVGNVTDWSRDTQQGVIRDALADLKGAGHLRSKCPACDSVWRSLVPKLGTDPLRFYRNPKMGESGRQELPHGRERSKRLRHKVYEIHAYMAEVPSEPAPAVPEARPVRPAAPAANVADLERFYREVQRLREFVASRDGFDVLTSMRVVIDGAKAIKAGAPVEGLLASIGATWQADTRSQARIPAYDYGTYKPRPSRFAHRVSEYVATLVQADVPVWLHGPAGTGKSSAAKYAAEQAGLPYYEVNLAGAMASAIKGKDRLKSFVESEFARAYEHGGVCCLEEFDAAHPTVATAVNNAIAGDEFHNDADGRSIKRHPDFRLVATANTLGTGATKEFNSRMKLDGATLDRFRMGRVHVGLDVELERSIFESIAGIR